jgi:hypothetical protein
VDLSSPQLMKAGLKCPLYGLMLLQLIDELLSATPSML